MRRPVTGDENTKSDDDDDDDDNRTKPDAAWQPLPCHNLVY